MKYDRYENSMINSIQIDFNFFLHQIEMKRIHNLLKLYILLWHFKFRFEMETCWMNKKTAHRQAFKWTIYICTYILGERKKNCHVRVQCEKKKPTYKHYTNVAIIFGGEKVRGFGNACYYRKWSTFISSSAVILALLLWFICICWKKNRSKKNCINFIDLTLGCKPL